MSISLILEMAVSERPDRIVVIDGDVRLTVRRLNEVVDGGTGVIAATGAQHVIYVGTGGFMMPVLLFASARAGVAFAPLNYRLGVEGLRELVERLPGALVVADEEHLESVVGTGRHVITSHDFIAAARTAGTVVGSSDPDGVAVVLFTSGTTSRPKAVELTHHNLISYVTGTVEFGSAERDEAALICVPPYHIAGVGAALSNLYAGRKMVYLRRFDPREWVRLVNAEGVTTATVVPTMLDRIVAVLNESPADLPTLRNLAYGGSKVALPLVRKVMELMPDVGLANAYGLTETSSTISVLTPEDHRAAHRASSEAITKRLGSVGRPVPGIEVQIRAEDGSVLGAGATGDLFVRGDQVSGRYAETGSALDAEGWFPTGDIAYVDDEGYLFVGGRSDDTIIRGGENIAPAELEDVLIEHPHVREVAVIGVEDSEWGQIIVAMVVPMAGITPDPETLRAYVRKTLRGSRTPDRVLFLDSLPTTPTGKVLRRELVESLRPIRAER